MRGEAVWSRYGRARHARSPICPFIQEPPFLGVRIGKADTKVTPINRANLCRPARAINALANAQRQKELSVFLRICRSSVLFFDALVN